MAFRPFMKKTLTSIGMAFRPFKLSNFRKNGNVNINRNGLQAIYEKKTLTSIGMAFRPFMEKKH